MNKAAYATLKYHIPDTYVYKKNVTVHMLRHTYASHLVMAGVDLVTVKELLGHADIHTTLRYAHLAPDHLKDAAAKLPF